MNQHFPWSCSAVILNQQSLVNDDICNQVSGAVISSYLQRSKYFNKQTKALSSFYVKQKGKKIQEKRQM